MAALTPLENTTWQFTRGRRIALLVLLANMALLVLFPPHDYVAMQQGNVPTFEGFRFIFSTYPNRTINANFLWLEVFAVLINFFVAWLLLRQVPVGTTRKTNKAQRALLVVVGINLVAMLMFPPFENFAAITKAVLPSFEGFYFVFGNNIQRQIVTPILYLEVATLLINAALLWLFLKDRAAKPALPDGIRMRAPDKRNVQKP